MKETPMTIEMTVDEHEILISAVNQLLDAHYAIYDYTQEESIQVQVLKTSREKLIESWKTRFVL
jgi:hypothetical protein